MLTLVFSTFEYEIPLYDGIEISEEVAHVENLFGDSCLYYKVK